MVHLHCYNKMPRTGWLIYNRNSFHKVLEAGKIKAPGDAVSHENFFPASSTSVSSLCPHILEALGSILGLFIRALILFMRTFPSWRNRLPKAPPPNIRTLRIIFYDVMIYKKDIFGHSDYCIYINYNLVLEMYISQIYLFFIHT